MGGEDPQRAEAVMVARRPARQRPLRGRGLQAISVPLSIAVSIAAASALVVRERARRELRGFPAEQAALRRGATPVARAARPEEGFRAGVAGGGRPLAAEPSPPKPYDPGRPAPTGRGGLGRAGPPPA